MSDPRLKKLRISTGVVKRCGKEKISYRKEADMQTARTPGQQAARVAVSHQHKATQMDH